MAPAQWVGAGAGAGAGAGVRVRVRRAHLALLPPGQAGAAHKAGRQRWKWLLSKASRLPMMS